MMKKFFGFIALAIFVVAFAAMSASAAQIESKEAAHLAELNRARARNGLGELKMIETLTAAAKIRAEEIVSKFEHTRPNGSRCYTAIDGWNESATQWGPLAENIASGKSLNTAAAAVALLMTSPGHRANILGNYSCVGLAAYQDASGETFWVEMFSGAKPSSDSFRTPQGQDNEQQWIVPFTKKNVNHYPSSANMREFFEPSKSAGTLESIIRPLQDKGRFTLLVYVTKYCGWAQTFMKEWEANKSLKNKDYVDVIFMDLCDKPDGTLGDLVSYFNSSAPTVKSEWKNARFLSSYPVGGPWNAYNDLLLDSLQPNGASSAAMPVFALYKDNKIIAYADGWNNGVRLELWSNFIDDLRAASQDGTTNGELPTGTDAHEVKADTGEGVSIVSQQVAAPDAPLVVEAASIAKGEHEIELVGSNGEKSNVTFEGQALLCAVELDVEHEDDAGSVKITVEPSAAAFDPTKNYTAMVKKKDGSGWSLFGMKLEAAGLVAEISPVGDYFSKNTVVVYEGSFKDNSEKSSGGGGGGCEVGAIAAAALAFAAIRRKKRQRMR